MPKAHDPSYSRDEDVRPGRPPRSATEPSGARRMKPPAETLTDPATGEPNPAAPAPGGAAADTTQGAKGRG